MLTLSVSWGAVGLVYSIEDCIFSQVLIEPIRLLRTHIKDIEDKAMAAMMDYLEVYVDLATEAKEEAKDAPIVSYACSGQAEYSKYR